jgi:hypothetical protein
MSDVLQNLRPGVYSRYQITGSCVATALRDCALVLPGGEEQLTVVTSPAQASQMEATVRECLRLLLEGGVGKVYLASGATVQDALGLLGEGDLGAIICHCQTPEDYAALKEYVMSASEQMRECIGFCAAPPEEAKEVAAQLCCQRVVLCTPSITSSPEVAASPLYGACSLAARILTAGSPVVNLSGEEFPLLTEAAPLPEPLVQELLSAGVCVFERVGSRVELIRAMTTCTAKNGAADDGLRSLNTVLIVDDVIRHIRSCLKARLKGAGITSLGSVRDQVAVELAAKRDAGILTDFSPPVVRPSAGDPTVCQVDLAFSVAHLVSTIHITAQIRV